MSASNLLEVMLAVGLGAALLVAVLREPAVSAAILAALAERARGQDEHCAYCWADVTQRGAATCAAHAKGPAD